MSFAIIQTGGKQYKVSASEIIKIERLNDEEGKIVHVGILLNNNNIIHAHGKVRIDRIDQTGIFNSDENKHSHKLRFIKKII